MESSRGSSLSLLPLPPAPERLGSVSRRESAIRLADPGNGLLEILPGLGRSFPLGAYAGQFLDIGDVPLSSPLDDRRKLSHHDRLLSPNPNMLPAGSLGSGGGIDLALPRTPAQYLMAKDGGTASGKSRIRNFSSTPQWNL
jgi:hypothetical protein